MFTNENGALVYRRDGETVRIEPWGPDALRVRATRNRCFTDRDWALEQQPPSNASVKIFEDPSANAGGYMNMFSGADTSFGSITNGKLTAEINAGGVLTFTNQNGKVLLKEFWRRLQDETSMALNIPGREYKPSSGDNYRLTARFVADNKEKIFGMGQYQQHQLNMKGCLLELAQRNSQASVPFYISSLGYGFLWNNPAVGEVSFANNGTQWTAQSSKELDYLVIAGDSPAAIEERYMNLVGLPPMMPEYGMGFWQCKLRYRTQDELLAVARRYKELGIPLDVIVADFFHWTQQGDYKFDPQYWPDVPAMCKELADMGIRLMVSIWPTADYRSENFREMMDKGYLTQCESGVRVTMLCGGNEVFFDATNEDARSFVWQKVKENYWGKGARLYWLDVAEPEYTTYQFENYRYQLGSVLEVGNIYPVCYAKGFYDGMRAEGDDTPISLIRCAWAGSAKYGTLVWSGDIVSNFECFNRQLRAGLSMSIAGIPWWTTDIGGFHGGNGDDPMFRELFVRWLQYACFCPVMRLHGNRNPQSGYGDGDFGTGSDNEIWSFGDEIFDISKKYIFLRERLRDYTREQMRKASEAGTPVMRPLFYDFPQDANSWETDDAYLYGPDLVVAPVLEMDARTRSVYLPAGTDWVDVWTKTVHSGGQTIETDAPIDRIPVFARKGAAVLSAFDA
ncbi:family 31 glucosidase [Ruminococcaceae bacterium OttesenSCG-928-L11]|nr:family 31 glucosidase [Ruminococcaceae bacterium OttesenSCG-928-L11]